MNHKLLKEIKDAGFPQTGERPWYCGGHTFYDDDGNPYNEECAEKSLLQRDDHYCESAGLVAENVVEDPTLEELIEWCGDEFESLVRVKDGVLDAEWRAYMTEDAFQRIGENCVRDCCGYEAEDTPKEAVARLGLAIHKKDGKETEKNE